MKSILKVLLFVLVINLSQCKVSSPCNTLDSSCSPISSLILERVIRTSRNSITFLPAGGSYKFDQFVNIVSGPAASVIRYTTDGSEPSCINGTIFTTPIPLVGAKTHLLKAAACIDSVVANTRTEQYIVTASPLSVSNLRFWYSADSIGTQNGMEVKVWTDYSGNGNHLYPSSTSLSNPVLITNALNGKPSVRLNSSQKQYMNTKTMSSYTGTKAGAGLMVIKKYSAQSEEVYFSIGFLGNTTNTRNWRGNLLNPSLCSSLSPAAVNCGGAATAAIPLDEYHFIAFTIDAAGSVKYYYDGTNVGSATLATPTSFSTANTMFLGTGLNVVTFLDAEILEVLFFEQGLEGSGDSASGAICPLKNKYGINVPITCQ